LASHAPAQSHQNSPDPLGVNINIVCIYIWNLFGKYLNLEPPPTTNMNKNTINTYKHLIEKFKQGAQFIPWTFYIASISPLNNKEQIHKYASPSYNKI
jgi:hypothetical protein